MRSDLLWEKIRNSGCRRCGLWRTAQSVCLIGRGPVPCDVMMVGEAPGFREDDVKKPFAGRAGRLLDRILDKVGISRDKIYITNVVHCRPPNNRKPTNEEINSCMYYLNKEIECVKPKKIILLGEVAAHSVLNTKSSIRELRGNFFDLENLGMTAFVTYHPAAALRRPFLVNIITMDFKKSLLEGFNKDKEVVYKDIDKNFNFDILKNGFAFDLETDGLDFVENRILSISFSPKKGYSYFTKDIIKSKIKLLMDDQSIEKQGFNLKFDLKFCLKNGLISESTLPNNKFFCSMIAFNIFDENFLKKDLETVATMFTSMSKWKTDYDFSDEERLRLRNLKDADAHRRLYNVFKKKLENDPSLKIPFKIDMDMMKVLVSAEYNGIKINVKELNVMSVKLEKKIDKLNLLIPINPNSNARITEYFKKLGIKSPKVTDKGSPSWSKDVLEKLSSELTGKKKDIVDNILNFREIFGIKTKFLDNLSKFIDSENKVHPVFNQVKSFENGSKDEQGTFTGRLSCKNPNLQQIPRDRENLPKELNPRRLFIPSHPEGFILSADYNQIEVRMAAHLANDSKLIKFLKGGEDVHRMVASMFYKKNPSEVTQDERKNVKKIVFGVIYMISPKGLAQNLGITISEAETYINRFFSMFPEQEEYILDTESKIITNGEISNIFGRRRRLPGATKLTPEGRTLIRQGVNFTNQSSSVDIVKIAAFRIFSEIIERGLKSRIFASVHDSIDIDGYPGEEDELTKIVKNNMENPNLEEYGVSLRVPLKASVKIGPNWLELNDV